MKGNVREDNLLTFISRLDPVRSWCQSDDGLSNACWHDCKNTARVTYKLPREHPLTCPKNNLLIANPLNRRCGNQWNKQVCHNCYASLMVCIRCWQIGVQTMGELVCLQCEVFCTVWLQHLRTSGKKIVIPAPLFSPEGNTLSLQIGQMRTIHIEQVAVRPAPFSWTISCCDLLANDEVTGTSYISNLRPPRGVCDKISYPHGGITYFG